MREAEERMRFSKMLLLAQIKGWCRGGRQAAGLLLGLALVFNNLSKYVNFANAVGIPVNPLEGFIFIASHEHFVNGLILGAIVLLSDLPFLTDRSRYEIIRIGRGAYLRGQLTYIATAVLIYMLVMAAGSVLMLSFMVPCTFGGRYSRCMEMLALEQPEFVLREFHIIFPYSEFITAMPPAAAFVTSFLLNAIYLTLLFYIAFYFGIMYKNAVGWAVGIGIHIAGYVAGFMQLGIFSALSPFFLAMPGKVAQLGGIPAIAGGGIVLFSIVMLMRKEVGRLETAFEI